MVLLFIKSLSLSETIRACKSLQLMSTNSYRESVLYNIELLYNLRRAEMTGISSDLRDEARDLLVESVIVTTLYCFVRLPNAADFEANVHAEIVGCS